MSECLMCASKGSLGKNHITDVFDDRNVLSGGRKLSETLCEMIGNPLEPSCQDKMLCGDCYTNCDQYDMYKTKMENLKIKIMGQYKKTTESNTTNMVVPKTENPIIESPKKNKGFVVPLSKLQPVPADFQLNLGKIAAVTVANSKALTQKSLLNLKVTIGDSVLTRSLTSSTVQIAKPIVDLPHPINIGQPTSKTSQPTIKIVQPPSKTQPSIKIVQATSKTQPTKISQSAITNTQPTIKIVQPPIKIVQPPIKLAQPNPDTVEVPVIDVNWSVNFLDEDMFSHSKNNDSDGDNDNDNDAEDNDEDNDNIERNNDENNEMEMDEANSPRDSILLDSNQIKIEDSTGTQYINAEDLMLGNIRIMGENGDQHTIMVDTDSSLVQMMAGQKLVYENGQLALVMDDNDDDDGPDSNDEESQIELQVSGDEETANAIIAAAQEQGGAFIKVESGEMYRVKSVQSKPSQPKPDAATLLVARDGDHYRCLVCDNAPDKIKKSFKSNAEDMMKHMKNQHFAKVYICALCGVVMRKRTEYTRHMAEHTKNLSNSSLPKPRTYECENCSKCYNSRTLLQEHMNLHMGRRPYQCHVCNKAFASKYSRQTHLKTHQFRPRPFKCNTCGKSFLSQQNLNQHETTHTGIKSFVCNICNKAFATQHNLEVHGVVHSKVKSHVCDYCNKAFARRAEVLDHIRIHTGERPFECDVCGAKFSQRSNLHSHKRATHMDDRRYPCAECPKRFKRRRLLEYHVKAAHTGERPLKCEECGSTFVYPEHYKKHLKIHSGKRSFFCEICGKAFSSRDNRNTHRFVHSDKKPYECLACGASYMRKRMLVAHMNAHGHMAESIVVNQPRISKDNEEGLQSTDSAIRLLDEDTSLSHVLGNSIAAESTENENEDTIAGEGEDAAAILTAVSSGETQEVLDENGSIVRLIQLQMSDGNSGWMALND